MKGPGSALLLMLGMLAAVSAPADGTNEIWLAAPWPPASKAMTDLQAAARRIAKETGGRVRVKFAEQNDLESDSHRCAGAVLGGAALATRSPAACVYSLPLLAKTPDEAERLRAWLESKVADELAAHGLAMVAWRDMGGAWLHSTRPLETAGEWQAARLWVPAADAQSVRLAEAYGVPLVALPAPEVRAALRAGAVEAFVAPPLGAILMQWHVETRCASDRPLLRLSAALVLRAEMLESLEPSDREQVRTELAQAFSAIAAAWRSQEPEALGVLAQNGVTLHPFGATADQQAEWKAWAAGVGERLAAQGWIPAGLLAEVRQTLAEHRAAP